MKRWLCACWPKHYELIQAEMLSWKYTLLMSAIKWILVSSFYCVLVQLLPTVSYILPHLYGCLVFRLLYSQQ